MRSILFAKLREDVKIPQKRDEDGCYDLYASFEDNEYMIPAHTTQLVPTGLISAFPSGYRVGFRERGSNTKWGAIVMAGQIDSGYRGEWFVAVHNCLDIPIEITKSVTEVEKTEDFIRYPYTKAICQFAIEEVPEMEVIESSVELVKDIFSERGDGMLGSSGK
jgi:dUTP pyrophosphatase